MLAEWTEPSATGRRIRVLVVDDSVVIRRLVTLALGDDPEFEIVGGAPNGSIALRKIPQVQPDVLTLDVEMPEMDGIETLRSVKQQYPHIRVVMFSTLTQRGAKHTFEALTLGADDYVAKAADVRALDTSLNVLRNELAPKIRQFFSPPAHAPANGTPSVRPASFEPPRAGRVEIVAIAVSTGGPNALAEILPSFPADLRCPILITQHMPPMFTRLLADRLDASSRLRIVEAADAMPIEAATAYVAPGDRHLTVCRSAGKVYARLNQDPPENSCRPAADVMFRSIADVYGGSCLTVVLTGMGQDGLAGARILKQAGAKVLAQDQASSVVWGMPGQVVQAGLADEVAPLGQIAASILRFVGR